jgi:hypothetical protein
MDGGNRVRAARAGLARGDRAGAGCAAHGEFGFTGRPRRRGGIHAGREVAAAGDGAAAGVRAALGCAIAGAGLIAGGRRGSFATFTNPSSPHHVSRYLPPANLSRFAAYHVRGGQDGRSRVGNGSLPRCLATAPCAKRIVRSGTRRIGMHRSKPSITRSVSMSNHPSFGCAPEKEFRKAELALGAVLGPLGTTRVSGRGQVSDLDRRWAVATGRFSRAPRG